jgi:Tfp pilus assembly protein FimT
MTLIELLVVISLMAIVAGAVAPALASLDRRSTQTGLDAVNQLLQRSRSTAIDRASAVNLTIDPATARYWVDPPDTSDVLPLPAGASLSATAQRVHFRFAANGEATSDVALFVRDASRVTPIVLESWSGEVRGAKP